MGISGGGINPLSRERKTWTFLGDMRHCFSESTGLNEAKFWYARLGVTYLFGGGVEGVLPSLCIGREVHFSKRTGMHIDADWFTYLDFLPQEYFQLVEFHSFTKFFQLNYSLFHGKVVGIKLLVTIPSRVLGIGTTAEPPVLVLSPTLSKVIIVSSKQE